MKTTIPTISTIYIITLLITQASAINVTQGVIFETGATSTQYYMNSNFTFTNMTVTPESLVLDSGNITAYPESGRLSFSLNRKENLNFTINATAKNITIQSGFADYILTGSANYLLTDWILGTTVNRSTATTDSLFFGHVPEGSYTVTIEQTPQTNPPSGGSSSSSGSSVLPSLPSTNTTNTTGTENSTTKITGYQDTTTTNQTQEINEELKRLAEEKIKHLREIITTDNIENTEATELLEEAEIFFMEGNYKKSIELANQAEDALKETIEEPTHIVAETNNTSNIPLIAGILMIIIIIIAIATILKRKNKL